MKSLTIYRETSLDIIRKIKYYKKLGVNAVIINHFRIINEDSIIDLLDKVRVLSESGLLLILEVDIVKITKQLIDKADIPSWEIPKIRQSLYQFLNYLRKYGVRAFYFKSIEGDFEKYIRELAKNTLAVDTLGIARIENSYLVDLIKNDFDYIDLRNVDSDDFLYIKSQMIGRSKTRGNFILSTDNSLRNFTNIDNYPFKSHSLVAASMFLNTGAPIIENLEELGIYNFDASKNDVNLIGKSNKTLDFYRKLLAIREKYKVVNEGDSRLLFPKDPDVFAFIKVDEDEKLLVFANFSQREALLDIRFHFLDLYEFKFLLGNYGRRTIVKNLLLRPFEVVSFIKTSAN